MKTIKAEIWEIKICDGIMGYVHNQFYTICECYIPELELAFNIENCTPAIIHIFCPNKERYTIKTNSPKKIKDIKLPLDFAMDLKKHADDEERLKKEAQKYL